MKSSFLFGLLFAVAMASAVSVTNIWTEKSTVGTLQSVFLKVRAIDADGSPSTPQENITTIASINFPDGSSGNYQLGYSGDQTSGYYLMEFSPRPGNAFVTARAYQSGALVASSTANVSFSGTETIYPTISATPTPTPTVTAVPSLVISQVFPGPTDAWLYAKVSTPYGTPATPEIGTQVRGTFQYLVLSASGVQAPTTTNVVINQKLNFAFDSVLGVWKASLSSLSPGTIALNIYAHSSNYKETTWTGSFIIPEKTPTPACPVADCAPGQQKVCATPQYHDAANSVTCPVCKCVPTTSVCPKLACPNPSYCPNGLDTGTGASGCPYCKCKELPSDIQIVKVQPGWNLVSFQLFNSYQPPMPTCPVGQACAQVMPSIKQRLKVVGNTCGTDRLYSYDASQNKYSAITLSQAEQGKAYWIKASNNCGITVQGSEVEEYTTNLVPGWNAFALVSLQSGSTNTCQGVITSGPFAYDPVLKKWVKASGGDYEGKGFFMKVSDYCTISYSGGGALPPLPGDNGFSDISYAAGVLGTATSAQAAVIEYSDYQDRYARMYYLQTEKQLISDFVNPGTVVYAFKDYPLVFHEMSSVAAQAARCAGDQEHGNYWGMHDKIFDEQQKLDPTFSSTSNFSVSDLKNWASQIGLDSANFNSCLDSGKYASLVRQSLEDATSAGVQGSPTALIIGRNGVTRKVEGAVPYAQFVNAINEVLGYSQTGTAPKSTATPVSITTGSAIAGWWTALNSGKSK